MQVKLREMVNEKTHEIFTEMQKDLGIKSGDIEPLMYIRLEEIQDKYAEAIKDVLLFQCLTNGKEARGHIKDLLTSEERDRIYYEVWEEKVTTDAMARAKDTDKPLSEGEAAIVADRYVNNGDYESGLSYWDNLDNLILEEGGNE